MTAMPSEPPAMPGAGDVLVVSDRPKLPPEIARLVDPTVPLPAGVTLFERKFTAASVIKALAGAAVLALLALICIPFGMAELIHPVGPVTVTSHADYWPLGFGLVCALAAWMMAASVPGRWRLRAEQAAGRETRVGILLTPTILVESREASYTVLPKAQVRGIDRGKVKFQQNGVDRTVYLPRELVRGTVQAMERDIIAWAGVG